MAGTSISIDTRALDGLKTSLRLMATGVRDTRTLMPRLGEYLQRSTQERFRTQTDPDGGAWAALQPRTRAQGDVRLEGLAQPAVGCRQGLAVGVHDQNGAHDAASLLRAFRWGATGQRGGRAELPLTRLTPPATMSRTWRMNTP